MNNRNFDDIINLACINAMRLQSHPTNRICQDKHMMVTRRKLTVRKEKYHKANR